MISCRIYDYIEIACMYGFEIRLTLKNGGTVEGAARDTRRNGEGAECMVIETERGAELVPLDDLQRMEALRPNAHFETVDF